MLSFTGCFGQKESLTLYVPIDGEPKSLDPQVALGYGAEVIASNCFEGLLRISGDKKLDFGVASEYTVDGLTYTFTLNPDARYRLTAEHKRLLGEDGYTAFDTRVKAEDFVYALRRALSPDTKAPYASKLFCIKNAAKVHSGKLPPDQLGVMAQGDYTLIVTLEYVDSSFLYTLATPVAMPCNPVFFEKTAGKYGLELDYILCNGPLYVTAWTHGSSVFVKKNPDYTGKTAVKTSLIGLMVNNDTDSRLKLLAAGTYDCDFVDAKALSSLTDTASLNLQRIENRVWGLTFNPKSGALENSDIRSALYAAVKASVFKPTAYIGGAASSLVPKECLIGDTLYATLVKPKAPAYSKSDAVIYWKRGLKTLNTDKVSVTVTCSSDFRPSVEKLVQQWQSVLGITLSAKINEVTDIELLRAQGDADYEVIFAPLQSDVIFAADYIENLCVNTLPISTKILNTFLTDMKKQKNAQKKAEAIANIEKYLFSQAIFFPVFDGFGYFAVYNKTQGLYYYASKNALSLYAGERYEE